jgi:hypothetical protein
MRRACVVPTKAPLDRVLVLLELTTLIEPNTERNSHEVRRTDLQQRGAFEAVSQTDRDQLMSECDAYLKEFTDSGELLGGSFALAVASTGRTVRVRNDLPIVTDGPFAEAKEQLARFYVLNAERSRPCPRPSVTN